MKEYAPHKKLDKKLLGDFTSVGLAVLLSTFYLL